MSWDGTSRPNPFRIATGARPTRASEVAIDRQTAKDDHFAVGQRIDV